jgi:hypothetical protein
MFLKSNSYFKNIYKTKSLLTIDKYLYLIMYFISKQANLSKQAT